MHRPWLQLPFKPRRASQASRTELETHTPAFCPLLPSPSSARPIFLQDQPARNHCHRRAANYRYLQYQPRACNKLWTSIAQRCPFTSRLMQIIGPGWALPPAGSGTVNHWGRRISSLCKARSLLPARVGSFLAQEFLHHRGSKTTLLQGRWVARLAPS